jgi:hypothetical protein
MLLQVRLVIVSLNAFEEGDETVNTFPDGKCRTGHDVKGASRLCHI